MNKTSVAIIGGGVVGAITADQLASEGLNVTIFESSDALGQGNTSACEGGILAHTQGLFYPNMEALLHESVAGWHDLEQRFPDVFLTDSFMRVAYHNEDMAALDAFAAHASQSTKVETLNPAKIHELEPTIAQNALGAILVHGERSIDTSRLMTVMQSSLAAKDNLQLSFNQTVQTVCHNGTDVRPEVILVDGQSEHFNYVVLAVGPHGPEKLLGTLPINPKLLSYGISAFLPGNFGLNRHVLTLNAPDKSGLAYIVPCKGGLKVGATKVGGDIPPEMDFEEHLETVRKAVIQLCPATESAFKNARVSVGLRDMRNPFCQKIPGTNIISVGGVGGAGTTVSTGLSNRVIALIQ